MVEKDITAPFSFRTYWCWIGEGLILGQPHHELFVISPISSGTTIAISLGMRSCYNEGLQLGSSEFLHDVPWLRVEYPEQCLVREPGNLLSYFMHVVDGITLGQLEVRLQWP
jgi:hypothetical protein